jgi:NAD-dependent dihydropyrimidine dehydrogenase PreA subunit
MPQQDSEFAQSEEKDMAYKIKETTCTGCSACQNECPNNAIVDPTKCTECVGFFEEPQCVAICPIPRTINPNPDVPRFQATV